MVTLKNILCLRKSRPSTSKRVSCSNQRGVCAEHPPATRRSFTSGREHSLNPPLRERLARRRLLIERNTELDVAAFVRTPTQLMTKRTQLMSVHQAALRTRPKGTTRLRPALPATQRAARLHCIDMINGDEDQ